MVLIIEIGKFILNIIYEVIKLLPVQNKILFISRQEDNTPLDFQLIVEEFEKRESVFKCVVLAKTIPKSFSGKIGYCFHMLRQMYHIATSKLVVLDGYCIMVSILKQRKSLIVIQMWHAMGAFKKFGYSILDKEEGSSSKLAKAMNMHKNYTYVFASSEYCVPFFAEAFNIDESKVKVFPLPRTDIIYREKINSRKRVYELYPELAKSEKMILYAPTFRKFNPDINDKLNKLVRAIEQNQWRMVIKPHPLMQIDNMFQDMVVDNSLSTIDWISAADWIVTDYSAVIFETLLMGKPFSLYAFDYEDYASKRDFYINYKETFKDFIYLEAKDIALNIKNNNYNLKKMEELRQIFVDAPQGNNTSNICDFIVDRILKRRH